MPTLQDKLSLRSLVGSSHSLVRLTCLLDGLQAFIRKSLQPDLCTQAGQ